MIKLEWIFWMLFSIALCVQGALADDVIMLCGEGKLKVALCSLEKHEEVQPVASLLLCETADKKFLLQMKQKLADGEALGPFIAAEAKRMNDTQTEYVTESAKVLLNIDRKAASVQLCGVGQDCTKIESTCR